MSGVEPLLSLPFTLAPLLRADRISLRSPTRIDSSSLLVPVGESTVAARVRTVAQARKMTAFRIMGSHPWSDTRAIAPEWLTVAGLQSNPDGPGERLRRLRLPVTFAELGSRMDVRLSYRVQSASQRPKSRYLFARRGEHFNFLRSETPDYF